MLPVGCIQKLGKEVFNVCDGKGKPVNYTMERTSRPDVLAALKIKEDKMLGVEIILNVDDIDGQRFSICVKNKATQKKYSVNLRKVAFDATLPIQISTLNRDLCITTLIISVQI